ncbi:response regulator transcription factor [Paenibacillus sp. 1P07SE]|uniref:response regulator transcription factor n=1 Tax=Paenibacillus sp. 1P07SE TaxID=3132209 RepID=UPI0039A44BC3
MFNLLIVDDEEAAVEALSLSIAEANLEIDAIHKAFSCEEALHILKRQSIDLVITDIQMPEEDGLVLVQAIEDRWKHVKCVLISGHAQFEYAKDAIRFGIEDYLLKPVDDQDLFRVIRRVQQKLRTEWEEHLSRRRIEKTLEENLPLLRNELLLELLEGRWQEESGLEEKLTALRIPFVSGEPAALMLIRLEEGFSAYGVQSLSLFEFAVGNIAEELAQGEFHLWSCKDRHDYLIIALSPLEPAAEDGQMRLERLSLQLQQNVQTYLKGQISIAVGRWGRFPVELRGIYEQLLVSVRKQAGGDQGFYLTVDGLRNDGPIYSIATLYEPPLLITLLESGRWRAASDKLEGIFDELGRNFPESQEHLREVMYVIYAAYSQLAHKNGKALHDVIRPDYEHLFFGKHLRPIGQCKTWALQTLERMRADMEDDTKLDRHSIVEAVREIVEQRISGNVTLAAIAEHVYLHPVYMAKVYKSQTGESVSDYLYRLRMDKAAHRLKTSHSKVYEIAASLGYRSAPYFIKVFKEHYGMSPQEYREAYADKHREREE